MHLYYGRKSIKLENPSPEDSNNSQDTLTEGSCRN